MAEQPEKPKMLVPDPDWPYPGPGTVSLYCDECGELYCEHRPAPGARDEEDKSLIVKHCGCCGKPVCDDYDCPGCVRNRREERGAPAPGARDEEDTDG